MRCIRWVPLAAILWLAAISSTCWADRPPGRGLRPLQETPKVQEAVKVLNVVSRSEREQLIGEPAAVTTQVLIPRKVLLQLLDQTVVVSDATPQKSAAPLGGTFIAGTCLAAAFVAAGFAWKRAVARKTAIGVAVLLAIVGVTSSGFANLAPIPRPAPPTKVIDNHPDARSKVALQVIEEDEAVQLILKR